MTSCKISKELSPYFGASRLLKLPGTRIAFAQMTCPFASSRMVQQRPVELDHTAELPRQLGVKHLSFGAFLLYLSSRTFALLVVDSFASNYNCN